MKKIVSIVLILSMVFCIAYQCSLQSFAVIGVDDAVVIAGLAVGLASVGVTVMNFSDFVTSDTWADLSNDISSSIMNGCHTVAVGGKLLLKMTKDAWNSLTGWVKSKVKIGVANQVIDVRTHRPSHPSTITLKDGTTVPWASFMNSPFVVYKVPSNSRIYAFYCTGQNVGVNFLTRSYRIWCTGRGQLIGYECVNGAWTDGNPHDMTYGMTYKGTTGSFYDVNMPSVSGNTPTAATQYRTMDLVSDSGAAQEQEPPNQVPSVDIPETVSVMASSEASYYPGSVDSPVEVIEDGEYMVFNVPDSIVVDAGTDNATITTNTNTLVNGLSQVSAESVNPRVQTNTFVQTNTVEQIITDTPVAELDGTNAGSAETDIELTNKFRLPRSFLEGFPFSIPYSIYAGIQSLIADPVAPSFTIPFSIPRLGIQEDMTLDLSQWDPVARLCRALLSLVWVAGLAMACNKFIKR